MPDYKTTLNLPSTKFPMKASLAQREPERLKRWNELDIYHELRQRRQGKEKYILHDGPPYANGNIHIGHALNKVLKDIVIKSKSLSGFDTPYVPGWDCHGLPIEVRVEKKIGKAGDKVTAKAFRKACREYAKSQIDIQRQEFMRLGVLGEWENPYVTMDFSYEANITRALATIVEKGYIQRGFKPVHWCIECGSALAEAEVEYHDKHSHSIDVRFNVVDIQDFAQRTGVQIDADAVYIPIWTTTPWTLPANQAVALGAKLTYNVVRIKQASDAAVGIMLVAESLHESVMQRFEVSDYDLLTTVTGDVFEGLLIQHPFYKKQVPVVMSEFVTVDTGTGAVHTAPGHGPEDYLVCQRYDIEVVNPVAGNGCYVPETELLAGKHVFKVEPEILELLQERQVLLAHEKIQHSYPCCWRHKTPMIFRATRQWFISMEHEQLRQKALASIAEVNWSPDWGGARLAGMIEQRNDWCISRQRAWGAPICLIVHKETGEPHPQAAKLMLKVADAIEKAGIDAWFDMPLTDLLSSEEAQQYEKINDVLDVWFDSGVTHLCVLQQRDNLQWPADMYLEGSDQHRGWFQSSLLSSVAIYGQAPYKTVLTHGFTVDKDGRKMSKSLGNTVEPAKVMQQLGADVLRQWIASTDYRGEQAVSDEILKRTADTYRRLRNTARFLLANLNGFDPVKDMLQSDQLIALDRWAIARAYQVQASIQQAYDAFQFHQVSQKIHHFCSGDMGSFYLDIIKDRQYTTPENSLARRSAQTAMYHIIEALVRWMMPILSFTADEIWENIPGEREDSVLLATWYENLSAQMDATMDADFWQAIIAVRDAVNKGIEQKRADGQLGSGLEAEVTLYCNEQWLARLNKLEDELRFVLITSSATVEPLAKRTANAADTCIEGVALQINSSTHAKCVRCWHRREDVGHNSEHPECCQRCVSNITGPGEERRYA